MTSFLRNLRETLTPIRTSSAFLTSGVLTPEEFVLAGDELVFKCPTWAWEGGDPKHRRKHLPPDKQYLITRNVPCVERANTCEASGYGGSTDEDGWFLESVKKGMAEVSEEDDFECIEEVDRLGENVKSVTVSASEEEGKKSAAVDDDDDFADMDGFDDGDDNLIADDEAVASTDGTGEGGGGGDNDNVRKIRTYDISITYDKYYQTPRVFLFGYNEKRSPLTDEEIFEDVMSDYAKRTVTIEKHPHTNVANASIHPCQHGKVMKNIVGNLMKSEGGDQCDEDRMAPSVQVRQLRKCIFFICLAKLITFPSPQSYLFIFLKFISSIIPTVNYDFTMKVVVK